MASKKFHLVVYDISNDRRRTKLHNLLLDYGTPVQYSVFECTLEPEQAEKMRKAIMKRIRPKKDRVRIYTLCKSCVSQISVTSGKEVTGEPPSALVVG
jgi:CRISPR-associated protein Cas2